MAVIKCVECGGNVSDKAETCPHCGAPVKPMLEEIEKAKAEAEAKQAKEKDVSSSEKKASGKTVLIILAIAAVLAAAGFAYYQVTKDVEPPVISGIEKDQTVDVTCGTDFNLKEYLKETIKISDEKDGEISAYDIELDEKVYNAETGDVDTRQAGTFDATIKTMDKAENAATTPFKLSLNPVHVTKDKVKQTVYDGKYGKIDLVSFKHGVIYDKKVYQMVFECTNKDSSIVEMYCSSTFTSINDQQISAYVELPNNVMSGKTKKIICTIEDEEIPDDIGDFKSFDTAAYISYEGADSVDDHLVRVPMVFDINAADEV